MSAGLSLLKKICVQGARAYLREVSVEHFTPEERPCYDYVVQHHRTYGGLPSLEALHDNGYNLTMVRDNETADYYRDRMRTRFVVTTARDSIQDFNQAVTQGNAETLRGIVENLNTTIRRTSVESSVMTIAEAIERVTANYEAARTSPGIQGITLGYDYLDDVTGGAQPGDVITLAARTGMGKSFFLNEMALRAWLQGHSILLVSMEMTCEQTTTRMISQYTGINADHIRRGTMSWFTRDRYYEATAAMIAAAPFTLVDGSFRLGIEDVDGLVQEFNPDIVYVDAAYLLTPIERRFTEKGWERQREMSKEMKRLALARNKPVVQTVQLNKDAVKKSGEDLDVGMIGGTDGIAQDSSTVILLSNGPSPCEHSTRDLIVAKNHEGRKTWMRTRFEFDPVSLAYLADKDAGEDQGAASGVFA